MTSGKDVQKYEEENYNTLVETFIELHKNEWADHVENGYSNREVAE